MSLRVSFELLRSRSKTASCTGTHGGYVSLVRSGEQVELTVTDDGRGFDSRGGAPEQQRPRIGEHRRARPSARRRRGSHHRTGTGDHRSRSRSGRLSSDRVMGRARLLIADNNAFVLEGLVSLLAYTATRAPASSLPGAFRRSALGKHHRQVPPSLVADDRDSLDGVAVFHVEGQVVPVGVLFPAFERGQGRTTALPIRRGPARWSVRPRTWPELCSSQNTADVQAVGVVALVVHRNRHVSPHVRTTVQRLSSVAPLRQLPGHAAPRRDQQGPDRARLGRFP